MKQVYHSNAVTNIHIRNDINSSKLKNSEIAKKFNISEATVSKWKNRENFEDKSSKPHKINYTFTDLQKAVLVQVRKLTWWSLDEITEAIFPENPLSKRSAASRTLRSLRGPMPECGNRRPDIPAPPRRCSGRQARDKSSRSVATHHPAG